MTGYSTDPFSHPSKTLYPLQGRRRERPSTVHSPTRTVGKTLLHLFSESVFSLFLGLYRSDNDSVQDRSGWRPKTQFTLVIYSMEKIWNDSSVSPVLEPKTHPNLETTRWIMVPLNPRKETRGRISGHFILLPIIMAEGVSQEHS